jgi:hypothetical protein
MFRFIILLFVVKLSHAEIINKTIVSDYNSVIYATSIKDEVSNIYYISLDGRVNSNISQYDIDISQYLSGVLIDSKFYGMINDGKLTLINRPKATLVFTSSINDIQVFHITFRATSPIY